MVYLEEDNSKLEYKLRDMPLPTQPQRNIELKVKNNPLKLSYFVCGKNNCFKLLFYIYHSPLVNNLFVLPAVL